MRRILLVVTLAVALAAAAPAFAGTPKLLQQGARGSAVRALQMRLRALGYLPSGTTDGSYGDTTMFAVEAFQKQSGLAVDGVAGPKTLARLKSAPRPTPRLHLPGRRIEVNLSRQVLYLVAENKVLRTIAVSTAMPGYSTPTGTFHIYRKERMSWSVPYKVWMVDASYFSGGYAIHGDAELPPYPASHGCVRIPIPFAAEVYAFDGYGLRVDIYR